MLHTVARHPPTAPRHQRTPPRCHLTMTRFASRCYAVLLRCGAVLQAVWKQHETFVEGQARDALSVVMGCFEKVGQSWLRVASMRSAGECTLLGALLTRCTPPGWSKLLSTHACCNVTRLL